MGEQSEELKEIVAKLTAPFDVSEIKFKPQAVAGQRALAVPFVDARVIQDRLDDAVGIMGWQDSYECLPDGSVVCRLQIRVGGEWVTKMDVGSQSEQPDEGDRRKAAFSDALKRAAVKFGIARYLYRQKLQWVDYDPQKRQFTRPPAMPVWTAPHTQVPAQQHQQKPAAAPPPAANGAHDAQQPPELGAFIAAAEGRAYAAGLCRPGALTLWLGVQLHNKYGAVVAGWPQSALDDVKAKLKLFPAHCVQQLVARKGTTLTLLKKACGIPEATHVEEWKAEQYAAAAKWLSELPEPQGVAR